MISLVVQVISRSKNNFYDVIKTKNNRKSVFFLKRRGQGWFGESKRNGGQLKATKLQ